jgi:hypothetical protein
MSFCPTCRHIPCECVDLCHGCDAELGEDRFCASCEEVMPVYRFPRVDFRPLQPEPYDFFLNASPEEWAARMAEKYGPDFERNPKIAA